MNFSGGTEAVSGHWRIERISGLQIAPLLPPTMRDLRVALEAPAQ